MKEKNTVESVESLQELAVKLEDGFIKRQRVLLNNVIAAVIASVIINAGATFIGLSGAVKQNTYRIEQLESLKELKELVAVLQYQYMDVYGKSEDNKSNIEVNRLDIQECKETVIKFTEKHFPTSTRGGAMERYKKSKD